MKDLIKPHKTLIVANGEKPPFKLISMLLEHAERLIALDGASHWLISIGVKPDLVIGDMDSAVMVELDGLAIHKLSCQNTNDLEKSLFYCLEHDLQDVSIVGAFGLRIDHFLTNLYVLKKYAPRLCLNMLDEHQCAFICPPHRLVIFDNLKDSYLSLFPLHDLVGPITSTGVDYPLTQEMLSFNDRIGTLNRIKDNRATLMCADGSLLVVMPHQLY